MPSSIRRLAGLGDVFQCRSGLSARLSPVALQHLQREEEEEGRKKARSSVLEYLHDKRARDERT